MKKSFILAAMLLLIGSPIAHASVLISDWEGNPIINGDKTYTLISATSSLSAASVDASGSSPYSFNLTNLGTINAQADLVYRIDITDPNYTFASTRVSQNAIDGNFNGGSTTFVYNDIGLINLLSTTTLTGTDSKPSDYAVTWLKTIFVEEILNVDADNRISNITFDVTQAVPEPSTYVLLGIALGVVGFARKRMSNQS